MRFSRYKISLQIKFIIFVSLTIFITLCIVGVSSYRILHNSVEESVGNYTLKTARIFSKMEVVQETLKGEPVNNKLQLAYEKYLNEVYGEDQIFLVLIDQEGVRYTHPNNNFIGEIITGNDIERALQGETYVSKARGISGTTVRTFVPVIDSKTNEQLGVISIGILHENIVGIISKYVNSLFLWILLTLLIGIIASLFFSREIKHILHGFEPHEIAAKFREKEAILESMTEGIIATNNEHRITLINSAARNILGLKEDLIGKKITTIAPLSTIFSNMEGINLNEDIQLSVNNVIILAKYYPTLTETNDILGTIITFRDITEVQELADKLTGVEQYIDGMRAKSHEFMNKLQTLSGLIELKRYEEVQDFIISTTHKQQELMHFFNHNIHEPKVTGLLLGKFQQSEELNINIIFTPGSFLGKLPPQTSISSITLILGNLIQNAMDAVLDKNNAEIHITILDSEHMLQFIVEDNGNGVTEEEKHQIFTKGFSTKGEERGIGLHLVKHHVEHILGGSLNFESIPGEGTSFFVTIPKKTAS